jgi:glycosyltransferase involved in cell wall biosynthesis
MNRSVKKLKVLHFVTGGFSGATSVAIDLVRAATRCPDLNADAILVLRRKRTTRPEKLAALRAEGLEVHTVSGLFHWHTQRQLADLCKTLRPDVMVAHGYPEHIIGRTAGLRAGVPTLVHVEHNSRERYTASSLKKALQLAAHTQQTIGVSEGVCDNLRSLGFPDWRIQAIPNGVDLTRFAHVPTPPWATRQTRVVMCARYASQKDHLTLIRASARLSDMQVDCPVLLAGDGKLRHRGKAEALARHLHPRGQVQFLGQVQNVPQLLADSKLFVLSTHYEGMPLALIEAMAAGCLVIGTDVPGVRDVIRHGQNGWLVPENDPDALAERIAHALTTPSESARIAAQGHTDSIQAFSQAQCATRHYHAYLLAALASHST